MNAFYIVNSIHDISYKYGFTEAAFKSVALRMIVSIGYEIGRAHV